MNQDCNCYVQKRSDKFISIIFNILIRSIIQLIMPNKVEELYLESYLGERNEKRTKIGYTTGVFDMFI